MDAIGNTYSVIGIPGQGQPWETLLQGLDAGYAGEVSDVVLRHGLRMADEAQAERLTADAKQVLEILVHDLLGE